MATTQGDNTTWLEEVYAKLSKHDSDLSLISDLLEGLVNNSNTKTEVISRLAGSIDRLHEVLLKLTVGASFATLHKAISLNQTLLQGGQGGSSQPKEPELQVDTRGHDNSKRSSFLPRNIILPNRNALKRSDYDRLRTLCEKTPMTDEDAKTAANIAKKLLLKDMHGAAYTITAESLKNPSGRRRALSAIERGMQVQIDAGTLED